jgi:F-type H+-transporting ATPase subunit epsilon
MGSLTLEIITPEKVVYRDTVDEVVAPTVDGEIAILPNHTNLLTQIDPGELIVKKGSATQSLAIVGGFLEIINNKISIVANYAIKAQDIEIAQAQEAKKRAERIMSQKTTENEMKVAQGELIKAILSLRIATKHKKHLR